MPAEYGSVAFEEQLRFFRGKRLVPTRRWADLWHDEHDAGFMVAGAMKADLLADLHGAVDRAISEGTTLATFRKDFDAIVAKHGWTGWRGEETAAGRAWRTRTIYETNLRASYQAGRWAQVQAGRERRPYLEYVHSDSVLHPRPLHVSWDGLVVHIDDPWVQTHWPPNGWGCKCRMFALSRRDLERRGKSAPDVPPNDGTYEWVDPVTGEVHTVPSGIDPGWAYAPGRSRRDLVRQSVARKVRTLPPAIGAALGNEASQPLSPAALDRLLRGIEDEIATQPVEHTVVLDRTGRELLRKVGDAQSVRFTEADLPALIDALVTHNHPVEASFSVGDVLLFVHRDLAVLRAVDQRWTYVLERPGLRYAQDEKARLHDLAESSEAVIMGVWFDRLRRGEITDEEFAAGVYHAVWEPLNETGLVHYRREPR